ncbi:MAG: DUF599 domain-containing protein [Betaproteobacteria bacterium]|nr:DUF599 domain-containing protein [Betaproteobacteria bacterium]
MSLLGLTSLDVVAAIWFAACWVGYSFFSEWNGHRTASLLSRMDFYRREWMGRTVQRENRIVDAAIVQNLFQGNNFLASTSILVLGGLAALLGASTQAIVVMASLPLAQASSERGFEIKIMLMIVIFIYAFFKFTWAMRQFNFLSLMIGTAPAKTDNQAVIDSFINRAATLASLAGENSNRGLRAFYFAMGAMSWFMHAALFMAASALVVGILYHREFRSRTLLALMENAGASGLEK